MENNGIKRAHSLHIDGNRVTVSGISSVVAINEKNATLNLSDGYVSIKGSGILMNKLSVEDGTLSLTAENIDTVGYGKKGGGGLKRIFK